MAGEKITQEEMFELFGQSMPIEAVRLCFESDDSKTIGQIRDELRAMAAPPARRKARRVIQRLISDPEMWATHGCPGEYKLALLEDEFTRAFETKD